MTVDPSDYVAESPEEIVIDPVELNVDEMVVPDDDTD